MSAVKVQKAEWVIVLNPDAIDPEGETVEYYKDPRTMGTITTRSPISAEWFDSQQQAESLLTKLKKGKSGSMFENAEICRLILGLQRNVSC